MRLPAERNFAASRTGDSPQLISDNTDDRGVGGGDH